MRVNEQIRYEPDDNCPPVAMLNVALQGVVIALANVASLVTIFAAATKDNWGSEGYLAWAVFAALVVAGAATALQAARMGRIGSGYILLMGPAAPFLGVCVLAVNEAGLPVMASLVVAASLVQFAMAFWLAQLRRIITPVVSGVAFMVVAAAAMPICVARLDDVPAGLSPLAGPTVGAVTLFGAAVLMLRASGLIRLLAIPITLLAGCVAAALLGVYDPQRALEAPWLDLPEFSAWPGLGPVLDRDFLALLLVFLIVSAVVAVKSGGEGAVIQQASWRRPRAIDFRGVQGTLNAGGIGVLLSGMAGILPVLIYLPSTVALMNFTGVAARRAGFLIGAMLIGLALLPKVVAVLLTIPRPVTGAVLMVVMGLIFLEGARTVLQDGFNQQKAVIVGVSLSIGIGLQGQDILTNALGSPWGMAFGNGIVVSVLAAVLLSVVMDMTLSRRRRMETELDIAALPDVDNFLREVGSRAGWNEASLERLRAAGEETLSSMLQLRDDYEGDKPPRLVLIARPHSGTMEIEFLAVSPEENIEDRLAYMSEQEAEPDVGEISFRLLRHYASSVRHRKYHGIDIVTVQVDAQANGDGAGQSRVAQGTCEARPANRTNVAGCRGNRPSYARALEVHSPGGKGDLCVPGNAARLVSGGDGRVLEVGHDVSGKQLDGAHHLLVGQAGEAEVAKDVVDAGFLGLLQPFYHHLRGAPERRQAGVARIVAAVPVALAVGPVLVALGDLAVPVHGHADGRPGGADRPQYPRGEILQLGGVPLRFLHGGGDVDGLGHGRVQVGVLVAVLFHLLAPQLDYLGRLAQDIGGAAGDDLYVAAGGEINAGRAGADGLEQGRVGLLQRLGQHPHVFNIGELPLVGEGFLGPGLDHHVDGFVEPVAAGVNVNAHAVELLLLVTGADAEVEPAVAYDVEHGHFLGHQDGVMQRQDDNRRADADVPCTTGHRAQEGPDSREQAVAGKAVLAQPYLVKAGFVGELYLLQGLGQRLLLGKVLVIGDNGKNPELHGASFQANSWVPC